MFEIETQDAIYEVEFLHAQINITSRCNMRCEHCRGSYGGTVDLSAADFETLLLFSHQHLGEGGGYLISGGEPLLHPHLKELLLLLKHHFRKNGFVSVTTNGTFLTSGWLDFLQSLAFPDLRIAISLDSVDPERNNAFRHSRQAFQNSVKAIKLVAERPDIQCIVRATIQKGQLPEVEPMLELVDSLGGNVLSVSSVIPVGRALGKSALHFGKEAKQQLVELAVALNQHGRKTKVDVNDPLAYIIDGDQEECGMFGGCIAGIGTFSVEPDGTMFPCPVLPNQVIMNIGGKTPEQILEAYAQSPIVHSLLERRLTGKCGGCKLRFTCGGCRARAEGVMGHYLAEDPDCWLQ
ncbi:MAG: radical SAM protein [Parcubacteria group bacterium]|nr:radical SAM protein [Parcubacteria group bacterium]